MTPQPSLPHTIKLASIAWAGAVAAGVIESALAVTRILGEGAMEPGDWLGLGIRAAVYAVAAALIAGLVRGSRTARLALTGLLSVVGLASLVVPAALEIAGGSSVAAALGSNGGLLETVFVTVRIVHVLLVIVATVAMYTPTANAYFRRPDSSSRPSRPSKPPAAAGS